MAASFKEMGAEEGDLEVDDTSPVWWLLVEVWMEDEEVTGVLEKERWW
jgi:hypothetical protein